MMSRLPLLAVLPAALLAACASPDYKVAAGQCRSEALRSYPVVLEQRMYRRSREVLVPDGSTFCESTESQSGSKSTSMKKTTSVCRPGMRKTIEYVDEPGTLDVNENARERYVSDCAASICMQRFGNDQCKQ